MTSRGKVEESFSPVSKLCLAWSAIPKQSQECICSYKLPKKKFSNIPNFFHPYNWKVFDCSLENDYCKLHWFFSILWWPFCKTDHCFVINTLLHIGRILVHHYSVFSFLNKVNYTSCSLCFLTLLLNHFAIPCNFDSIFLKLWLWKEDTALLGSHWCWTEHNYYIFICSAAAYPVMTVYLIAVSQV